MIINLTEDPELVDVDFGDKEDLLASISEDTMIDNILDQIEFLGTDENTYRNSSLFQYFRDRIDYIRTKYPDDVDAIQQTNEVLDRIFSAIQKKYALDVKLTESLDFAKKLDYVEATYNFFVLNIFERTSNFFKTYILDNLEALRAEGLARLTPADQKNLTYRSISDSAPAENIPVIYFLQDFLNGIDLTDSIQVLEYMMKGDEEEINNHLVSSLLINESFAEVNFLQPLSKRIIKVAKSNPSEGIDKNHIITSLLQEGR